MQSTKHTRHAQIFTNNKQTSVPVVKWVYNAYICKMHKHLSTHDASMRLVFLHKYTNTCDKNNHKQSMNRNQRTSVYLKYRMEN